jgi:tetraacyldisaccharide 4'-kinase
VEWLRLPACAFGLAAGLRAGCYESGLLRAHAAAAPVFSLGNITAGGTGKTPGVVWLARELARRGRRPGVLSRGYGAPRGAGGSGWNDESRMLQVLLPGVVQVARADRVRGAAELVAQGAQAIVLDDGFQHRRLARDADFVLVDATRPWGLARDAKGASVRAFLPRGLLRESPRELARADVLIVTRADQVPSGWLADLCRELETYAPGVPQVQARHAPRTLRRDDGALESLDALAGADVDLISGIGNPQGFADTVRSLGARIHAERRFSDHHPFGPGDAAGLGGAGRRLLCTAKDLPKLAALGIPCAALEVELEFLTSPAALEARIDAVLDARVDAPRQSRRP